MDDGHTPEAEETFLSRRGWIKAAGLGVAVVFLMLTVGVGWMVYSAPKFCTTGLSVMGHRPSQEEIIKRAKSDDSCTNRSITYDDGAAWGTITFDKTGKILTDEKPY